MEEEQTDESPGDYCIVVLSYQLWDREKGFHGEKFTHRLPGLQLQQRIPKVQVGQVDSSL